MGPALTVFFGDAGSGESDNAGHLWAITGVGNTAAGRREKWAYNDWPNKGSTGTYTGVWDEPALVQNKDGTWEVVFGTSDPDQSVYALNAVDGSLLWRFQTLVNGPDEDVGAGPTIGPPGSNGFADGAVYVDGKDAVEYRARSSDGPTHLVPPGWAPVLVVLTSLRKLSRKPR